MDNFEIVHRLTHLERRVTSLEEENKRDWEHWAKSVMRSLDYINNAMKEIEEKTCTI